MVPMRALELYGSGTPLDPQSEKTTLQAARRRTPCGSIGASSRCQGMIVIIHFKLPCNGMTG